MKFKEGDIVVGMPGRKKVLTKYVVESVHTRTQDENYVNLVRCEGVGARLWAYFDNIVKVG